VLQLVIKNKIMVYIKLRAEVHAKHMTVINLSILRQEILTVEPQVHNTVVTRRVLELDHCNRVYNVTSYYSDTLSEMSSSYWVFTKKPSIVMRLSTKNVDEHFVPCVTARYPAAHPVPH